MKLNKVRKLIEEIVKERFNKKVLKDKYHWSITEFADKTYQVSWVSNFDKTTIKISTPFHEKSNQRIIALEFENDDGKIYYQRIMGIGKEITK